MQVFVEWINTYREHLFIILPALAVLCLSSSVWFEVTDLVTDQYMDTTEKSKAFPVSSVWSAHGAGGDNGTQVLCLRIKQCDEPKMWRVNRPLSNWHGVPPNFKSVSTVCTIFKWSECFTLLFLYFFIHLCIYGYFAFIYICVPHASLVHGGQKR